MIRCYLPILLGACLLGCGDDDSTPVDAGSMSGMDSGSFEPDAGPVSEDSGLSDAGMDASPTLDSSLDSSLDSGTDSESGGSVHCELEPSFFPDDPLLSRGARVDLETLCGDRCPENLDDVLDGLENALCDPSFPVVITGCGVTTVRRRWSVTHYDSAGGDLIGAATAQDVYFSLDGDGCEAPEFHGGMGRPDCDDEVEEYIECDGDAGT